MKKLTLILTVIMIMCMTLTGCKNTNQTSSNSSESNSSSANETEKLINSCNNLNELRKKFSTNLTQKKHGGEIVPLPTEDIFKIVKYTSPIGELSAYISPNPNDGKKYPAIIWISGGFDNSIGEFLWEDAPPDNDQSAAAFRKSGIVLMVPSIRGGNNNPGYTESLLGEIDDVIAAEKFLSRQPYVDPKRIYLGGHSTGGTLALLVAESLDKFRAVFSFGPAESVANYGDEDLVFNTKNKLETSARAPIKWLNTIKSPTFVFEGVSGNYDALLNLERSTENKKIKFFAVQNASHFSTLSPLNKMLAKKILEDSGDSTNIQISDKDVVNAMNEK